MRVLMFGWEYPPHNSGGLGVACFGLTHALAYQNAHIDFVLPRFLDIDSDVVNLLFADIENVSAHGIKTILAPYVTSKSYLKILSSLVGKSVYGDSLFEEVERYSSEGAKIAQKVDSFDIIHAHDWLTFGAGMAAREVSDKPLVVHVHASEVERTAGHGGDERVFSVEQQGMRHADRVIAVSGLTKQIIVKSYGINSSKVEVVHNGIEPSSYNINSSMVLGLAEFKKLGYKIVLFVGRITISKGVDYLIHAAKIALTANPKLLFVIVGSGDMERQIINLAAEQGISRNILFTGFARGKELSSLYKSADLFVMPSVMEPFGLVALESLVHGTPIIVSKQSGVSEVITHALTTDFWDTWDLADKILSVTKYPSLHDLLSVNGKKQAYDCNWQKAASKCLAIYNQLV